jgi:dihydroneopterin aldolase
LLKVCIEDLTFKCILGILDIEREKKQKVIVNISFKYYFNKTNSKFIDYSKIVSYVKKTMKKKKFKLIEDAILFIKKDLKSTYNIKRFKIKISKPNIISNCIVSIAN